MPTPTEKGRPHLDPNSAWVLQEAIEVLAIIRNQSDPDTGIHPTHQPHLLGSLIRQAHHHLLDTIEQALTDGHTWNEIRAHLTS